MNLKYLGNRSARQSSTLWTIANGIATLTVPVGESWVIQSAFGNFTTNATVGTRLVSASILDETNAICFLTAYQTGLTSSTVAGISVLNGSGGVGTLNFLAPQAILLPYPSEFFMKPGYQLKLYDLSAISTTDAWTNLNVNYRAYMI
jgi:hypothetical protein